MADTSDFIKLMKKTAVESIVATQPTNLVFGTVTNANDLEITIEQNLKLLKAQLILTRNVTEFTTEVTVDWETEKGGETKHDHSLEMEVLTDGDPSHEHEIEYELGLEDISHIHEIKGIKEIVIHNDLKLGENVILLRMQGGQKFLVLDRVVGL